MLIHMNSLITHPSRYRAVYDSVLGWGIEDTRDGSVVMVKESVALHVITMWKRIVSTDNIQPNRLP